MQIAARIDRTGSGGEKPALIEADKRGIVQGGFAEIDVKYWGALEVAKDEVNYRKRFEVLRMVDDGCRAGQLKYAAVCGCVTISSKQVKIRPTNVEEPPFERIILNDLVTATHVRDDGCSVIVFTFLARSSETHYRNAVVSVASKEAADRICDLVQFSFEVAFGFQSSSDEKRMSVSTPASTIDRRSVKSEVAKAPETPTSLQSSSPKQQAHFEMFRSSDNLSKHAQQNTLVASNLQQQKNGANKTKTSKRSTSMLLLQNLKNAFTKSSGKSASGSKSKSGKHKGLSKQDLPLTPATSNSNITRSGMENDYRLAQLHMASMNYDSLNQRGRLSDEVAPITLEIPAENSENMTLTSPSISPSVANRTIRSTNSALSFATGDALQQYIRTLATRLNIVQLKRFSGLLSSFVNNRLGFEDFCESLFELYGEDRKFLFPGLRPFVPDEFVPYFENFLMSRCDLVPNFIENPDNYRTITGTISSGSTLTLTTMTPRHPPYNRSVSCTTSSALQSAFSGANDDATSLAVVQEFDRILSEIDESLQVKQQVHPMDSRKHLDSDYVIPSALFAARNPATLDLFADSRFLYKAKQNSISSGRRDRESQRSKPLKLNRMTSTLRSNDLPDNRGTNRSRGSNAVHQKPSLVASSSRTHSRPTSMPPQAVTRSSSSSRADGRVNVDHWNDVYVNGGAVAFPPYRGVASSAYYRQFRNPGDPKIKSK